MGAFDLVDRGKGLCRILLAALAYKPFTIYPVFKYETSWGRTLFEVFGSKGRYSVSVDLPAPVSTYCACPAFAYSVLLSDSQAMVSPSPVPYIY